MSRTPQRILVLLLLLGAVGGDALPAHGFGFVGGPTFWRDPRTAPGTRDLTFGDGGLAAFLVEGGAAQAQSVALQSDGKIVMGGASGADIFVSRLNPGGVLDTTWSTDGVVKTDLLGSSSDVAQGVAISPITGKIAAAGHAISGGEYFGVALYNTNGTLDTAFDTDGIKTFQFSAVNSKGKDVAFQSDGKIVVSGEADSGAFSSWQIAVARMDATGAFDGAFGTSGQKLVDINGGLTDDRGNEMTIAPDGSLFVAASTFSGLYYAVGVTRLQASNGAEAGLDGDGKITTDILGGNDYGFDVAVNAANTKFAVAGGADSAGWDCALAYYNINGTLDTGFNGTGKVTMTGGAGDDFFQGVAIQSDGKIVVVGHLHNGTNNDMVVARYNTNGTLDTTFGGTGKIVENSGGDDIGMGVAIDSEGRIVVVGASNGFAAAWRYWN